MNLTPYAGNKILLGFRFKSDAAVNYEGWYVDDIRVISGTTTIFSDDAETPSVLKVLNVNVTYPHLTLLNATDPLTNAATLQYTQHIQQVPLQEDISHPGTYSGYFDYASFGEQYSGNYTITLDAAINGTPITAAAQFQTTIFGCQNCHYRRDSDIETSYIHGEGGGIQSCTYLCHSGSRGFYVGSDPSQPFMGPPLTANPMHVHEMQYGHSGGFLQGAWYSQPPYDISSHVTATSCTQCHTSFLHDNTGTDTANIASYTLKGTSIGFSSGTHNNLTCENCHGTLNYPAIPQDQFQLKGELGASKLTFTSYESFTDTYIISVNGAENLTITITGENTTKNVELYTIGPVDNTATALQGPCGGNPCNTVQSLSTPINMNITGPFMGTWIVKLIQLQDGEIKYTISSNYPIQRKPIIRIPECNSCHNPGATGKAFTTDQIPDWNPGFAHADANGDGLPDVQCRMCHNAMHNITIKDCHTCHTTAPVNHPISEPSFSQYTQSQCLACHGDPHKVTAAGGGCVGCHSSPGTRYYVNTSLFGRHTFISGADQNVTDEDCMGCHFGAANITMSPDAGLGAANSSNTYFCEDCHSPDGRNPAQYNNISLQYRKSPDHGKTDCKWCHLTGDSQPRPLPGQLRYHPGGPVGTAAGKNCLSCHYYANLPDSPFHAPGEGHSGDIRFCGDGGCHDNADNHAVTYKDAGTPPSISGLSVTPSVISGTPAQVLFTVSDDMLQIAAAQYQLTNASGVVLDWTNMTPQDGMFNSMSEGVNATIDTSTLQGTYNVKVKGMSSAPRTDPSKPYYPLNGKWSGVASAQFTVVKPSGFDNGTVYGILGNNIAGATVSTNTGIHTTTNESGFYSLSLENGTYQLIANKEPEYYQNSSVFVTVTAFTTITQNIILTPKPTGNISGVVMNR
ncbi:Cytochrome c7 c [uncultured archaeon]|nr:Cytochrome c7 c [uncultured archaeon]